MIFKHHGEALRAQPERLPNFMGEDMITVVENPSMTRCNPPPLDWLFPSPPDLALPAEPDSAPAGPFAGVALEKSLDRLLDYAIPKRLLPSIQVGQRVRVPLGRKDRGNFGYVVSIHPIAEYPKIKNILDIDDQRVLISPTMMELARWMSRYYCAPLGAVIDTIIPSAVKKKIGVGYSQMVRLAQERTAVQEILEKTRAPKRRAILARLLQLEPEQSIELVRLAGEAGVTPATVRKLVRLGLITISPQIDLPRLIADMPVGPASESDIVLNEDQQRVFDELLARLPLTPSPGTPDFGELSRAGEGRGEGAFPPSPLEGEGPGVRGKSSNSIGDRSPNESETLPLTPRPLPQGEREPGEDLHPNPVPEYRAREREERRETSKGGFSVNLLHGVTGSGKTEIYLQCIRAVIESGRQAIVLVPEIALTPQTVRRFTARFKRVAILHSGLTATERHRFWQQISQGHADVVVGARSAIFAPMPKLGMIVVDEEHESSYKQDTAPRYHARDVAIKRAQIEGIPILLGSATPALETYWKCKGSGVRGQGSGEKQNAPRNVSLDFPDPRPLTADTQNFLLTLPRRVRGLSLPPVELVDMKLVNRYRRGVHLISERLEHLLRTTIESRHQAILLLNRRGYSNFVYCVSCMNVIQCKYCDTTMTYHRSAGSQVLSAKTALGVHTGQLHCHYCLAVNALPEKCPQCGKTLSLFGLGTQRVEEELAKKFPDLKYARVDSDSMRSSKDYEATLGKFARGEIQVMLGTQMIAKGLDYPNVTLVGVISGDTALALPDFRAAERTFQLITQVAGRAGRGDSAGRVVLQTFLPDDPTIRAAIRQDFVGFAKTELAHRKDVGLPPFTRMVRIILRDQEPEKLHRHAEELAALLIEAVAKEPGESAIRMKGPMPCPISRIAGYYRDQIVLLSPRAAALQRVLATVREKGGLARSERVAVDVDPVSLL